MRLSNRHADIFELVKRINNIPLFFDRGKYLTSGKGGEKDYAYVCRNAEAIGGDYSMPQITASVENNKIVAVSNWALIKHLNFLGYEVIKEDHKSDPIVITLYVRKIKK